MFDTPSTAQTPYFSRTCLRASSVVIAPVGSINATIVIFDRIRENMALAGSQRNTDLKEVVNKSITQTLSRSINTSLTTFIMVFMLFILGVSSIREFAGPLMVGVICGGYSSVCITGALWYVFKTKFSKKKN